MALLFNRQQVVLKVDSQASDTVQVLLCVHLSLVLCAIIFLIHVFINVLQDKIRSLFADAGACVIYRNIYSLSALHFAARRLAYDNEKPIGNSFVRVTQHQHHKRAHFELVRASTCFIV